MKTKTKSKSRVRINNTKKINRRGAEPQRKAPKVEVGKVRPAGLVKAAGKEPLKPLEVGVLVSPNMIDIDPKALREKDPRRYGKETIEAMAFSIGQGQITTVALARIPKPLSKDKVYRVVAGNRRVLGCIEAGVQVRADIYDGNDPRLANATIVENIERCDWNVMDEAEHVAERVQAEINGGSKIGSPKLPEATACKVVANSLGRKESWVKDRVLLATRLSGATRKMVVDGRLPLASAKEIAKLADPTIRDKVAERVVAKVGEGGVMIAAAPIERVKALVHEHLNNLATVSWRLDVPFAGKPACVHCPKNSANNAGLFEGEKAIDGKAGEFEITSQGVCLDPACFQHKTTAIGTALKLAVKTAEPDVAKHAPKQRKEEALAVATRVVGEVQRSHTGPTCALVPKVVADAVIAKIDRESVKPTAAENAKDKADRSKEAAERAASELQETARMRLYNRRVERAEPIRKAFAQIVQQKPHAAVAVLLSGFTSVMQGCAGGNEASRKKAGQSQEMTDLLAAVAANDWDGVRKVLRLVNVHLIGQHIDLHALVSADVEDAWAQAMDVTLPAKVTLEQMVEELKAAAKTA